MADQPDDGSQDGPGDGQNPFKGTPFEQLFQGFTQGGGLGGLGALGALGGAGGPGGMPDLSALLGQIQQMMQPYDGPLNWEVALDLARKTVAQTPDPTPTKAQQDAVADAVRLADHWLDQTTSFPSGVTTTAAWSRAEWVEGTLESWKVLVEPVAEQSVGSMASALPEQARAQAGPILGMLGRAVGVMLANQVGSGLGALASEVVSVSDVGVPLAPAGRAALVPSNIAVLSEGLDVPEHDVLLYLALREAAHQRLFAGVPWLRDHVVGAVTDYARGVEINVEGIQQRVEEQMRGLDPSDPAAMQKLLEGGMFELPDSPAQKAALERLETVLALVEGWVDEVVHQATEGTMPDATKLQELIRRRRAAGGPAEQTFATLVGLELRPRRLRDASTLWGSLRDRQGIEARDGVWMSPQLLPTAAELDDPLGFREGASAPQALSEEDFDAELRRMLDGTPEPDDSAPHDDAAQGDSGDGGVDPEDTDDASDPDREPDSEQGPDADR